MIRNYLIISLLALFISIYFNVTQLIEIEAKDIEINISKELSTSYAYQRNLITELIPILKPQITKTELKEYLKSKYTNEPVNELENLIQWRLYHFWFENNAISSVQVGS